MFKKIFVRFIFARIAPIFGLKTFFFKDLFGGRRGDCPWPPLPPAHVPIIAMYFVCTGPEKESVSCNY